MIDFHGAMVMLVTFQNEKNRIRTIPYGSDDPDTEEEDFRRRIVAFFADNDCRVRTIVRVK